MTNHVASCPGKKYVFFLCEANGRWVDKDRKSMWKKSGRALCPWQLFAALLTEPLNNEIPTHSCLTKRIFISLGTPSAHEKRHVFPFYMFRFNVSSGAAVVQDAGCKSVRFSFFPSHKPSHPPVGVMVILRRSHIPLYQNTTDDHNGGHYFPIELTNFVRACPPTFGGIWRANHVCIRVCGKKRRK